MKKKINIQLEVLHDFPDRTLCVQYKIHDTINPLMIDKSFIEEHQVLTVEEVLDKLGKGNSIKINSFYIGQISDDFGIDETKKFKSKEEFENLIKGKKRTFEDKYKEALEKVYNSGMNGISHVGAANYQSRQSEAESNLREAFEEAEKLLKDKK